VIAIDDLSGGFLANVPRLPNLVWEQGDIKDAEFLHRVFEAHKPIDYVYHLAAYAAEGLSHFIRSYNYRTNLVGSVEILNMAVKFHVECFVFTSSIAVYGSINDLSQMQNANRTLHAAGSSTARGVLTEEDRPTPEDPYGISKNAMELDLHAARELWGRPDFVIFRPHNVYGPKQNIYDRYRNVVGIFINQLHHDQPMTIFGDGKQVRAFSYIDDVAPIIARGPLVPAARNKVFNVGADKPYTLNELATEISTQMGKPQTIKHEPARLEALAPVADHTKVRTLFAPPPTVSLAEGLAKTVKWFRAQGAAFRPVEFATVEIKERIPPSWDRSDMLESEVCHGTRVHNEVAEVDRRSFGAWFGEWAYRLCAIVVALIFFTQLSKDYRVVAKLQKFMTMNVVFAVNVVLLFYNIVYLVF